MGSLLRMYERAMCELEDCKRRIAAVELENAGLRAQMLAPPQRGLGTDGVHLLVHLFKAEAKEDRDIASIARALAMERNVLQYHLDRLEEAGLVCKQSGKYLLGHVYWALTSVGRKQVVEGRLV